MTDDINSFQGEYDWLSNFSKAPVTYEGVEYPSVENAYQAAKFPQSQREFFLTCTPSQSKAKVKGLQMSHVWHKIKLRVMDGLLQQKFRIPEYREKLLATGDRKLIEGNWWNDTFWGVCKGKGENHLGRLIMKIRDDLRSETC